MKLVRLDGKHTSEAISLAVRQPWAAKWNETGVRAEHTQALDVAATPTKCPEADNPRGERPSLLSIAITVLTGILHAPASSANATAADLTNQLPRELLARQNMLVELEPASETN